MFVVGVLPGWSPARPGCTAALHARRCAALGWRAVRDRAAGRGVVGGRVDKMDYGDDRSIVCTIKK